LCLKRSLVTLLFLLLTTGLTAQTLRAPAAAAFTFLTAYSKTPDAASFSANQASLANARLFSAALYTERRFGLAELSYYKLSAALPLKESNFGVTGSYLGSAEMKEMGASIAYGRKLTEAILIGAQFNYYSIGVQGYENASAATFEGGILIKITEQVFGGFHLYNPTGARLNKSDEHKLPPVYKAGIGYQPSDKFLVSAEIEKMNNEPVSVAAGAQYTFDKVLLARAGFNSATSNFYLGAGVLFGALKLDVVAAVHAQLGLTPGLQLIYNATEK